MGKWADFGIFRVKYNSEHTAIVEVEVKPDNGETFGSTARMTRAQVVSALDRGHTFITIYERDGKYRKGDDVRAFVIQYTKYIRTDGNQILADNLGSLPEYH